MLTIVDYGMGNLGSIQNMLKKVGVKSLISSNRTEILSAEKLILPGVGAFDAGMKNLAERGLIQLLTSRVVRDKIPVLGICLGMQLLSKSSEEGVLPGLGWIDAKTIRFRTGPELRLPHMGWNSVRPRANATLFSGPLAEKRFYFVHSFHLECADEADVAATATHGYDFACSVQHENIFGTQFHPEKSHQFGMDLLRQFTKV